MDNPVEKKKERWRWVVGLLLLLLTVAIITISLTSRNRVKPLQSIPVGSGLTLDLMAVCTTDNPSYEYEHWQYYVINKLPAWIRGQLAAKYKSAEYLLYQKYTPEVYEFPEMVSSDLNLVFMVRQKTDKGTRLIKPGDIPAVETALTNAAHSVKITGSDPALSSQYFKLNRMWPAFSKVTGPVVFKAELKNVTPFEKDLHLQVMNGRYHGNSATWTIPNPYYVETTPLTKAQPLPATDSYNGLNITVESFGARKVDQPPITSLNFRIWEDDKPEAEWLIKDVQVYVGESLTTYPLEVVTINQIGKDDRGRVYQLDFETNLDWLNQPLRITLMPTPRFQTESYTRAWFYFTLQPGESTAPGRTRLPGDPDASEIRIDFRPAADSISGS